MIGLGIQSKREITQARITRMTEAGGMQGWRPSGFRSAIRRA